MRELSLLAATAQGMGLAESVSFVTDGRYPGGATRGPCVGHVDPEAARVGIARGIPRFGGRQFVWHVIRGENAAVPGTAG